MFRMLTGNFLGIAAHGGGQCPPAKAIEAHLCKWTALSLLFAMIKMTSHHGNLGTRVLERT